MSRSRNSSDNAAYSVGYKRPPTHTRFRKGVSGNPKGRPRKSKSTQNLLLEELESLITISERGQATTITKRGAFFKSLVTRAIKGEGRAASQLLGMIEALESSEANALGSGSSSTSRAHITQTQLFPMSEEEWGAKFGPNATCPKEPEDHERMSEDQLVRAMKVIHEKTADLLQEKGVSLSNAEHK